ncbi:hypothetical protein ROHU_014276 [Labeo rohita]|uniref:Uncharacterized protein n=1 Tax=Labeo rohita TaxID=84645 RepID=A0A498NUC3_LABRO|nr:hypothetical protein ROHU_014276 [Labeo rohita]
MDACLQKIVPDDRGSTSGHVKVRGKKQSDGQILISMMEGVFSETSSRTGRYGSEYSAFVAQDSLIHLMDLFPSGPLAPDPIPGPSVCHRPPVIPSATDNAHIQGSVGCSTSSLNCNAAHPDLPVTYRPL